MDQTVNTHEAKTRLSALLMAIEQRGESFVICRNGRPIADLVPHRAGSRLAPHSQLGEVRIGYDPTEPLDDEDWPEDDA